MHERMKKITRRIRRSLSRSSTFDEGLSNMAIPEHEPAQNMIHTSYTDYSLNKRISHSFEDILHEDRRYESRNGNSVTNGSNGNSADNLTNSQDFTLSTNGINTDHHTGTNNIQFRPRRNLSEQDLVKRLSLPNPIQLTDSFVAKHAPKMNEPLSLRQRRASLSEIGFGKVESYIKLDKLGEGTYATVYKGQSVLTKDFVALKEIRLEHDEGAPCTAIREVALLRHLKHNNIVTLHDIIHTEKSLTLVFEYLERDLKQYMDDCGNILSMDNVKLFLFQLLRGLDFCHKRRVLHRDLKPQNLLINNKGELKLADFGLARAKSIPTKTYSNEVVTLWYRPPEVLLGLTDYSSQIDMWGVGCIFFEMSSGRPLFPGSTVEDQLHLIFKTLGTPAESTMPGCTTNPEFKPYMYPRYRSEPVISVAPRLDADGADLFSKLVLFNKDKRMLAGNGMLHSYFNFLGPQIHQLQANESIYSVPGVQLVKDPGIRSSGITHGGKRRQSMLF